MKIAGLVILLAAPIWAAGVGSTAPCWIAIGQEGPADDIIVDTSGSQPEIYLSLQGVARQVDPTVTAGDITQLKRVRDVCVQGGGSASGSLKLRVPQSTARPLGKWVVADFNGDGRKDSVSVNANVLTVQLGAAGTTFGAPVRTTVGGSRHAYTAAGAADVNGDGKLDLVVCCTSTSNDARAVVLLGNGNGTFAAPVESVPASSIALTDWNRDGTQDLIAATPDGGLTVALGQGNGSFQVGRTALAAGVVNLLVADATGDGVNDVVVINSRQVLVYIGQADGSFANSYGTDLYWNQAVTLTAGDFTGDGKLDVAVTHQFGMTEILRGNPPSGFVRTGMVPNHQFSRGVAVDLDENGTAELLLPGVGSGGLQVVATNAQGTPTGAAAYGVAPDGTVYPEYDPVRSAAAVGDFDRDGRADVVLAAPRGSGGVVQVFTAVGPALPTLFGPFNGARVSLVGLQAADVTGDGRPDLVVLDTESSSLLVFRNLGTNRFDVPMVTQLSGTPQCLLVADFNNDSRPDVAIGIGTTLANSGRIEIRYNSGTGDFSQVQSVNTGATPARLATADFNGDFKTDLVFLPVSPSGNTPAGLVMNRTSNVFAAAVQLPLPPYSSVGTVDSPGAIQVADANSDGSIDVLISAPFNDGSLLVLLGDGKGTFRAMAVDKSVAAKGADLLPLDADEDGKLDVLVAHCCGDTTTRLYYGRGDGTFAPGHVKPTGSYADRLWVTDVNGDGFPELVARTNAGVAVVPFFAEKQLGVSSTASGRGPTVAVDSMASAYGSSLSYEALGALFLEQTEIAGVRMFVTDTQNKVMGAPLFYVSPSQVNFQIPPGLSTGPARVTLQTPQGPAWFADIVLARVAPGLFMVDVSRLVAANVIRVRANGQQLVESPYSVDGGVLHGAPVDLGPVGDKVVLVLYATGLRGRNGLGEVTATIGGVNAVVEYAGPQNQFPGFDQVNVVLPRSLAGRGSVDVVVTVEGQASNAARILVQ